jgi:multiple sugar transport system substrate-binding protein
MKQAGGWVVSADGKTMTADSPANLTDLSEIKKMMTAGSMKFTTDTSPATGDDGEAFGKGIGAMTIEGNWIEGNWIKGSLSKDFASIKASSPSFLPAPLARAR